MNTAVINIKTQVSTKAQAQKVASELGLSLSSLINAYLKQLIKTRRVEFDLGEEPSAYLKSVIKNAEENYRKGKTSPAFKNVENAIEWLDDPHARLQNGDKV